MKDDLVIAAADLSNVAPESWAKFVEAFGRHVDQAREDLVASPVDMLQIAQGRAQAVSALLKGFVEVRQRAARIRPK